MIQLLFIILAAAIIGAGIVGFARGFLRNFSDQDAAWHVYRARFYRQIHVGFGVSILIGLLSPSVWIVLLVSVVASALVGRLVN